MSRTPARTFMGDPEQIGLTHAWMRKAHWTCTSWEDFSSRVSKKRFQGKRFPAAIIVYWFWQAGEEAYPPNTTILSQTCPGRSDTQLTWTCYPFPLINVLPPTQRALNIFLSPFQSLWQFTLALPAGKVRSTQQTHKEFPQDVTARHQSLAPKPSY